METASLGAERARLELLLEVTRACSSTLDRGGILHTLAERLIAGLGASGASFSDVDHAAGSIHTSVHHVVSGRVPMVADTHCVPITWCPFLERVVRDGTAASACVDDPWLSPNERAFLTRHGMQAEVLAPIVTGGRTSSLLEVFWDRADKIVPETLAVCAAIAEQAGVALENARLYAAEADLRRRAEARARRLEHVQRVGERLKADLDAGEIAQRVVDATRTASGFRMVVLNLVDEPDDPESPWRVVATAGIPPKGSRRSALTPTPSRTCSTCSATSSASPTRTSSPRRWSKWRSRIRRCPDGAESRTGRTASAMPGAAAMSCWCP